MIHGPMKVNYQDSSKVHSERAAFLLVSWANTTNGKSALKGSTPNMEPENKVQRKRGGGIGRDCS